MTTAHRPTWNPAQASKDQGGNKFIAPSKQFSARDLPGHTTLKYRQEGQNTVDEISQRDLKEELLKKEADAIRKRKRNDFDEEEDKEEETQILKKPKPLAIDFSLDADDASEDSDSEDENEQKEKGSDDESDSEDDSEEDDDEDEEEALRRELEKIKQERALSQQKKAAEEEEANRKDKESHVLYENPLLAPKEEEFSLKKKWYDDVVFKNQARDEPKQEKRFINDTIRNDFHRKFLNKFVK